MIAYKRATYRVKGYSPLLMNNPKSMRQDKAGGDQPTRKKIPTPEVEAASKVYRLGDGEKGQLFAPADALRSSLIDGGKGHRVGKDYLRSLLQSCVFLTHEICPLVHPETGEAIADYVIDVRRCVIQGSGVQRARPKIEEWATEITLEYDPDALTPEQILWAFETAGKRCGIGDYRPSCPSGKGGPFGRYTVELMEDGDAGAS